MSDRCSLVSLAAGESIAGTASTYRTWVLLEQPGPWGVKALRDAPLPPGLGARLLKLSDELGMRVLLIRRHGAGAVSATRRHAYFASTGPEHQVLEETRLERPEDLLDLDLAPLARGESLGLDPVTGPLYLVCTHGRHDVCCAERGRPVAAALSTAFPERTWESSHLGGDRFAGNLLCLPHGLYYGRLTAESAPGVAASYANGEVNLDALRGRCCYPFPVQAAEIELRRCLGRTGVDGLVLRQSVRDGDVTSAEFALEGGRTATVRVRTTAGPERMMSCGDEPSRPRVHEVLDIS